MCFFLVMWLMGADEEVKQAVANYFNNPTSAWRPDLASSQNMPLGSKTGAGENVLNGLDGQMPEDMVNLPSTRHYIQPEEARDYGDEDKDLLSHRIPDIDVNIDLLKFSIPEKVLFKSGSDEFTTNAKLYLEKVGKVIKKNRARLAIKGATLPIPSDAGGADSYEFSIARVVAVMKYLVARNFLSEQDVSPQVLDQARIPASGRTQNERIIEFVVSPTQHDND
jgi:flagellar motor protein MotB